MPVAYSTVSGMERPTYDSLLGECERLGVAVMPAHLSVEIDGAYIKRNSVILLDKNLADFERVPVLLHEMVHVERQDNGHQSARVERWIDEQVALRLIDPFEYAHAESELGWHTGGIAAELDVPRWVVQAYRRVLERERLAV